jgi:hypothetical protein
MKPLISRVSDKVYVFLFFFIFFLLNLTANFSGPHDSMGYLNDIIRGRNLFPAPHLLYHFTVYLVLHILQFLFPRTTDFYLVEAIDAFWGCLGLTMIYRIFVTRILIKKTEAFLATCICAFSFGMWFYCSNIEVYMPPLFFLLWALYICTGPKLNSKNAILLASVHIMAVLFHQVNVLFTPIIIWKYWISKDNIPFLKTVFLYAASSIAVVGGLYFILGWYVEGQNNIEKFSKWIRGYTLNDYYWSPLGTTTFLKAFVGWGHAFFGGHFIFNVEFIRKFMNRIFYYHSLDDEIYLVRGLSHTLALTLLVFTLVAGMIMLVLLIRIILNWKKLYSGYQYFIWPLLSFLVIYSLFFCFWIPENLEFWIPQTAILWILLIGLNSKLTAPGFRLNYKFYLLLLSLILTVNYVGSIYWMKDINNDIAYVKTKKVDETATARDIIILQDPWIIGDFLEYYTKAPVIKVPTEEKKIDDLNQVVNRTLSDGGKVYLFLEGVSLNSSNNRTYIDSLISANIPLVTDMNNALTPVKYLSRQ